MLTDIDHIWEPRNKDDWEETLKYTKIGLEKTKNDIKEKTKKLRDKINNK